MNLLNGSIDPNDADPEIKAASGGPVDFLADVDFIVCSENRVWLPVDHADVLGLKLGQLTYWQTRIVQMNASILD